jgi:hypothetical protein
MPDPSQTCGNCFFMMPQVHIDNTGANVSTPCCRFEVPQTTNTIQGIPAKWAVVDPVNDWCGHWSGTGVGVFGSTGGTGTAGPNFTTGTAAPSGGNNGDWYLQTGISVGGVPNTIFWQRQSGSWVNVIQIVVP